MAPSTSPSQQALRQQPIRFQLLVYFKGMLAFLRASSHSLRVLQLAQGGRPPTCSTHRPAGEVDGDSERIAFHKKLKNKVFQKHPVPLFCVLFYTQIQRVGAVGQSYFLQTSTWGWPCHKPKLGGGGKNPVFQMCLSVAWWIPEPLKEPWLPRVNLCSYDSNQRVSCQTSPVPTAQPAAVGVGSVLGTYCSGHDADWTTYLQDL